MLLITLAAIVAMDAPQNAAINAVYDRLVVAKNSRDPAAIVAEFDPRSIVVDPRPLPAASGASIAEPLQRMMARLTANGVKVETRYRVEKREMFGDYAVDSGYMQMRFVAKPGAGKPDDMVTRFLTTLQREPDGSYRIVGDASFLAAPGDWEKLRPVSGLHFDN